MLHIFQCDYHKEKEAGDTQGLSLKIASRVVSIEL